MAEKNRAKFEDAGTVLTRDYEPYDASQFDVIWNGSAKACSCTGVCGHTRGELLADRPSHDANERVSVFEETTGDEVPAHLLTLRVGAPAVLPAVRA